MASENDSLLAGEDDPDDLSLTAEFAKRKDEMEKLNRIFGNDGTGGGGGGSASDKFANLGKQIKDIIGKTAKQAKQMEFDTRVSRKGLLLNVVAQIGVVLYIIHMEANWDAEHKYVKDHSPGSNFFRFLMAISTAILIMVLFDCYQMDVWLYRKFEATSADEIEGRFWPRHFVVPFLVDLLICFIHPIPRIIPNKVGVFMLLRFLLMARILRDNSELYQKRGIIYKSGYIDRGGPPIDTFLCMKTAIDKSPALAIAAVVTFVTLAFAYATYLIQREGTDNEGISFFHSLWATMFLLLRGQARFESYDGAGRLIEMLVIFAGILTLAFIIALVTTGMDVTPQEKFAITWLHHHDKQRQLQVQAAELIQAYWRFHRLKIKAPEEATMEVEIYLEELMAKHKKFRLDCEITDNMSLDPSHDKLLLAARKMDVVSDEINQIKAAQQNLMSIIDKAKK